MDLDKAFVSSLLETGPNGLKVAFDKGVTADLLIDEGQRAFEFAVDYLKNYGSFPTPDILEGKLGITLDDTQQAPLEFYADEIINRRLHSRLSEGMREGVKYLELNDPKAAYEQLAGVVYKLRTDNLAGSRVVSVPFLGDDVLEYYRKIKAGERGVLTPWDSLNEATFGFWPEDLILFVSRTGVGKTWLSLIMAHYAWTQGKRVLFVTTEVAKLSMGIRWVALANQLSYAELRHGRLTSQDEHKMVQGVDDFKKIDGFYMVGGDFDFRIESLELSIGEVNPDLVIADGAYLLKSDGNSRTEKAANVFDELKRVAKRCAVPLIITTQFNREVKSGSEGAIDEGRVRSLCPTLRVGTLTRFTLSTRRKR